MRRCDYCDEQLEYKDSMFICPHCNEYKQSANIELMNDMTFEASEEIIINVSWYYARKYNMSFEDLQGEAFIIYCKALDTFNGASSFRTHLHWRLRALENYCIRESKIRAHRIDLLSENNYSYEDNPIKRVIFYEALKELDRDSRRIINGILDGIFDKPDMKRQRIVNRYRVIQFAIEKWKWNHGRAVTAWTNLETWWQRTELAISA